MSRITTPASIDASPVAAQPLLVAVKKQLGSVPNLFHIIGNSPAALDGYLGLNGALGKGAQRPHQRPRPRPRPRPRLPPVPRRRRWASAHQPHSAPAATPARRSMRA